MSKFYLDGGTTWSKILQLDADNVESSLSDYFVSQKAGMIYYILPSSQVKKLNIKFEKTTGHSIVESAKHENEIVALAKGVQKLNPKNEIILDLGSRDAKWVKFNDGKFHDLDWNNSCGSATGATIEMLLKFYNIKNDDLCFVDEKYNVTCGIFGFEKIMDDISNGVLPNVAVAKFIHGIAFNAWTFAKRPDVLWLSGGFCENPCFIDSLNKYCQVQVLGRFILCNGLY